MDAFYDMQAAAAADGISLWILSSFRSYEDQDVIYNRYVAQDAEMPQIHILHVRVIPITRQDTHSILILSNRTSSTIPQANGLTRTATSTALSSVILRAKKAQQAICMSRGM